MSVIKKKINPVGKWETKRVFVPAPGASSEEVEAELERQKMNEVRRCLG